MEEMWALYPDIAILNCKKGIILSKYNVAVVNCIMRPTHNAVRGYITTDRMVSDFHEACWSYNVEFIKVCLPYVDDECIRVGLTIAIDSDAHPVSDLLKLHIK
jgi:hypothetical protein